MSKRCCGILYPDSEKYCVKCGEPLVDEPDNPGDEPSDNSDNKDNNKEDNNKENDTSVLSDEEMGVDNSKEGADREQSDVLISGGDEKTDVLANEPGKRKFHGKTVRDAGGYFEEEERIKEAEEEKAEKKSGASAVMKTLGIISLVALVLFAAGLAFNYYLLFKKNPKPVFDGAASVGLSSGVSALKDIDMNVVPTATDAAPTEDVTTEENVVETAGDAAETAGDAAEATGGDAPASTGTDAE